MLWWFGQDLIIAAALAGLVCLACWIWRIDPVARHALWLIVLAKLVTPPLIVWPWAVSTAWDAKAPQAAPCPAPLAAIATPRPCIPQAPPAVAQKSVKPPTADAATARGASAAALTCPPVPPARVEAPGVVDATPAAAPLPSGPAEVVTINLREPVHPLWPALVRRAVIGIWIAGSIAFLLVQCVRILRMTRRLRRAAPAQAALAHRVASLSGRLQIRPVPVRIVSGISSPAIWAVARPTLLWPAELELELSDRALDGLIVHELAHARRRDHWVAWLELLAGCVWWWNPLFWYVRHQVRENTELACDAWVVDTIPKGRRAYAEALLAVCEHLTGRPAPAPALGARTGGRRFLERRLAMILREHFPLRLRRFRLVATLLLAMTSLPVWAQKTPAPPDANQVITLQPTGNFTGFQPATALPPEAATLLNQYKIQQAAARETLIGKLKEMAATADASGSPDAARAIRRAIEVLQSPCSAEQPLPDPGTLTAYRGQIGKSYLFEVTGNAQGFIWGSGIYTDDSALATVAVHAGLLKSGEKGVVRVTIQPALDAYEGSNQNGVESASYGPWGGSFTVGPYHAAVSTSRAPVSAETRWINVADADPADQVRSNLPAGTSYTVEITGSTTGTIWGNGIYTTDGSLSTAAVHCGALRAGEKGMVTVTLLPGQDSYEAATRNGVTSQSWGRWTSSFVVQKKEVEKVPVLADPTDQVRSNLPIGTSYTVEITGSINGSVWGNGIYTTDCSLSTAAVHCGVLRAGETGLVTVTILPGQNSYEGATRNGVTSLPYGAWTSSFVVQKTVSKETQPLQAYPAKAGEVGK